MHRLQGKPISFHLCRAAVLVVAVGVTPLTGGAQQDSGSSSDSSAAAVAPRHAADDSAAHTPQKTFFVKRDLVASGIAFAASVAVSSFDLRIAHWARSSDVQGDSSRHDRISTATRVNETPLTIAAFATWGIGRLAHSETTADIGLHTFEALVLTTGISEVLRGTIGRTRPREAPEDQFLFKPGKGFTQFETRSYPSLHTAAAFATATALVGEIHLRRPDATKWAAPLLYTAAMVPGLTRIYLDQHWASDVVAGGFVGALLGSRVVSYAHSHKRNRLDRALLAVNVVPDGHGGTLVLAELPW
jgi:membrane-associated phospholipid phosphatase